MREFWKLLTIAVALWLMAFFQWNQLPFSSAPIPDSDTALYWYLSKVVKTQGFLFGNLHIFFSTYYAYLYYALSLVGNPVKGATLLNGLLYIASVGSFALLLKELYDWKAAKVGALLFLLTKPLLFYSLLPIKTMAVITLFILFLLLLTRGNYLFSGIAGGVLFNLEGITLPLILLYALYFLVKKQFKGVLALTAGLAIAVAPAAVISSKKAGGFSLSSPTSGIHFYIGNRRGANGFYRRIRGIRPNAFGHYYDAKRLAELEAGKKLTDKEVNLFWWSKGINEVFEDPLRALELYLKKLLIFFNNYEVPNNYNLYMVGKEVWIVGLLPINFAIALALGIAGFLVAHHLRLRKGILDITLIAYPLILALFFITSRYRVIYYIPLLAYGALLLSYAKEISCKREKLLRKALIGAAVALSISNFPVAEEVRAGYTRVFRFKLISTAELERAIESKNLKAAKLIFLRAKEREIARDLGRLIR